MKDYKIGRVVDYLGYPLVECNGSKDYKKMSLKPHADSILQKDDVVIGYTEGEDIHIIYKTRMNKNINPNTVARFACNFINNNKHILLNDYYEDINVYDLDRKTRIRSVMVARQISQFIYKLITNKSFEATGKIYGGKNHSTVMHSIHVLLIEMINNKLFRDILPELVDSIVNYKETKTPCIQQHNFQTCQI